MKLKGVRGVVRAQRDDIADLRTQRAMPVPGLNALDPFLFLNHHGPQNYKSQNSGLPFGPHPHRGFETLTLILEGDILHRDSSGAESVIESGGVQWMRAGRGIVHSEESSDEFKKKGGPLEILQLWINLPSKMKMSEARYVGLQKDEIPSVKLDGLEAQIICGNLFSKEGPVETVTDPTIALLSLKKNAKIEIEVPAENNLFFYVISGNGVVNGQKAEAFETVLFNHDHSTVQIHASEEMKILFAHAKPIGEPVVSYGPFVMTTREEIMQAISDFQNGSF